MLAIRYPHLAFDSNIHYQMLSKIILFIFFVSTAVQVQGNMWRGPIRVRRDKNNVPIFGNQDVQDFGCVVIKTNANPDIPPMLSVSGGATPKECAQFEITTEEGQYQFKELTTGKLMARHGHWFYVDGEPGTKAANTIFLVRSYVDKWNGVTREAVLVPYDLQSREIHAQYMSGDLNVKNSGFKMYVNLA